MPSRSQVHLSAHNFNSAGYTLGGTLGSANDPESNCILAQTNYAPPIV